MSSPKPFHKLRLECSASLAASSLKIVRVKHDGGLWIVNETIEAVEMGAKEIFGFNIGSFAEVPSGLNPMIEKF